MDLPAALAEVVATLAAAEVDATTDPARVRAPGALVQLADVDPDLLDGATVRARVLLVAADRDDPRTLATLGDLLGRVLASPLALEGRVTPGQVALPGTAPATVPCLSLTALTYL